MNKDIVAQDEQKVKLLDLVNRADKMLAVLLADEDEDSPMGRAMTQWLLDAEAATESNKCAYPGCEEPVYRDGLCWEHFIKEKLEEWDAQDVERRAALEGVGYLFDDPLDMAWYGHPVEEVCR